MKKETRNFVGPNTTVLPTYDGRIDPIDRLKIYLKKNKNYLIRKLFYFAISLFGCCYQIYFISAQFFAYNVITDLTITRPPQLLPPRLAVCFMAKDMRKVKREGDGPIGDFEEMSVDKLLDLSPKTYNNTKEMTLDGNSLITGFAMAFYNETTEIPLETLRFFKREEMCFSYFPTNSTLHFNRDDVSNKLLDPEMYGIMIHNYWLQHLNLFRVFFYNTLVKFYEKSDSALTITRRRLQQNQVTEQGDGSQNFTYYPMNPNKVNVGYTQYNSWLLESPFKSNCLEYRKLPKDGHYLGDSQAHCFDTCALDQLRNTKSPSVLGGLGYDPVELYNEGSKLMLITQKRLKDNKDWRKIIDQVEVDCKRRCYKSDCERREFVPRIVSQMDDKKGNETRVSVYLPTDPEITVRVKPILYMIDYITYVLSCISFWLGFAPYGFLSNYDLIQYASDFVHIRCMGGRKNKGFTRVMRAPLPSGGKRQGERKGNQGTGKLSPKSYQNMLYNWVKSDRTPVPGRIGAVTEQPQTGFINKMSNKY